MVLILIKKLFSRALATSLSASVCVRKSWIMVDGKVALFYSSLSRESIFNFTSLLKLFFLNPIPKINNFFCSCLQYVVIIVILILLLLVLTLLFIMLLLLNYYYHYSYKHYCQCCYFKIIINIIIILLFFIIGVTVHFVIFRS